MQGRIHPTNLQSGSDPSIPGLHCSTVFLSGPAFALMCPSSNDDGCRFQTLIVEGYFEGNYRGGFLAVPKGGKYVGMANVRRAEIGGRLHGTLSARTLLEVMDGSLSRARPIPVTNNPYWVS